MKFPLHFLLAAALCLTAVSPSLRAEPAAPAVAGIFNGNDKPAALAFVSARKGEPVFGKETIVIIFSEKDHSKAVKPEHKAGFGDFGSALVVTVNSEGQIVSTQVAHSAHGKGSFSSGGTLKMSDFKNADGEVQGKMSTGGVSEFFKKTWEVELTFHTKAP